MNFHKEMLKTTARIAIIRTYLRKKHDYGAPYTRVAYYISGLENKNQY